MISVLIPAAGSGTRLGGDRPKALMPLAGRPLLLWSVEALARVPGVGEVLVAGHPGELAAFEELRVAGGLKTWARVIEGGETRADSVHNLLSEARGDRVMVHDAARPCVITSWVAGLIEALGEDPAGVPALPVRDTLKRGRDGFVIETVSREELYAIQTPQLFDIDLLRRAHAEGRRRDQPATDDAMLVEALGESVRLLPGDPHNLKVTWPGDVAVAERWLREHA